jgi:hypothetical protein
MTVTFYIDNKGADPDEPINSDSSKEVTKSEIIEHLMLSQKCARLATLFVASLSRVIGRGTQVL